MEVSLLWKCYEIAKLLEIPFIMEVLNIGLYKIMHMEPQVLEAEYRGFLHMEVLNIIEVSLIWRS